MPCYIAPIEGPTAGDLVRNREALYASLILCNIDKKNLREFYDVPE